MESHFHKVPQCDNLAQLQMVTHWGPCFLTVWLMYFYTSVSKSVSAAETPGFFLPQSGPFGGVTPHRSTAGARIFNAKSLCCLNLEQTAFSSYFFGLLINKNLLSSWVNKSPLKNLKTCHGPGDFLFLLSFGLRPKPCYSVAFTWLLYPSYWWTTCPT